MLKKLNINPSENSKKSIGSSFALKFENLGDVL